MDYNKAKKVAEEISKLMVGTCWINKSKNIAKITYVRENNVGGTGDYEIRVIFSGKLGGNDEVNEFLNLYEKIDCP